MVTIATHILNKYLPNKTLPTYTFLSCKQLTKLLKQQYKKTGHSPLNTTISQHLVKIHLIGEQIQNISDLQSADIMNLYFGIGVHKFPKVPQQYFVTPVFDNQKLYDTPSELHSVIITNMQPPLSVALILSWGLSVNTNFSKRLWPPNNFLFISS